MPTSFPIDQIFLFCCAGVGVVTIFTATRRYRERKVETALYSQLTGSLAAMQAGQGTATVKPDMAEAAMLTLLSNKRRAVQHKAVVKLYQAAMTGDVESLVGLGHIYTADQWKRQDLDKALTLYELAHRRGHPEALRFLASTKLYHSNPDLHEEGLAQLEEAANLGSVEAMVDLALVYGTGTSVPQDLLRSYEYMAQAADRGSAFAQYHAGKSACMGIGCAPDSTRGLDWLRKAADQEYFEAYTFLVQVYEQGIGVPVDLHMAEIIAQQGKVHIDQVARRIEQERQQLEAELKAVTRNAPQRQEA